MSSSSSAPPQVRPRRQRRVSRTRQVFLTTIQAQITGTRILAAITFVVLAGSAFFWLSVTTGSPVVGYFFVAMAAVLSVTIYSFLHLMGIFAGKK